MTRSAVRSVEERVDGHSPAAQIASLRDPAFFYNYLLETFWRGSISRVLAVHRETTLARIWCCYENSSNSKNTSRSLLEQ